MTTTTESPRENISGVIKCRNGHIEYHIGQKFYDLKDNSIMMFGKEVKDGYYFLQLDAFDVKNFIEALFQSLSNEQQINLLSTLGDKGN